MEKCSWCWSPIESGATVCPKCKLGQVIKIPDNRLGECACNSGKLLLATLAGNGQDHNYCAKCISEPIAKKLVDVLISQKVHFPNSFVEDKIISFSSGSRRGGKYPFSETTVALEAVMGTIQMSKEKSAHRPTVAE